MNKKKRNIIISVISACAVVALTLGLVLGLGNFSSKPKIDQPEQSTQGTTSPVNDKYWDEAHDAGEITLDFDWAGSGTQNDPWLISSAEELAGLSYGIYKNTIDSNYISRTDMYYYKYYFKQTCDIDLADYYWQPIGVYYDRSATQIERAFTGIYDGNGYTITGLFTKNTETAASSYQGLFGYVFCYYYSNLPKISNVCIKDSIVQGYNNVAGIAGVLSNASIEKCCFLGKVQGHNNVGGLAGSIDEGTIKNSYNVSEVIGNNYVGGIIGCVFLSNIYNCYNLGDLYASDTCGGLCGYISNSSAGSKIVNCYNSGVVAGENALGGVIGRLTQDPNTSFIKKIYFGGNCALSQGISGVKDCSIKYDDLHNSSRNKEWYLPSSQTNGNITWDSSYPWDFENVWKFDIKLNDGYPVFVWQESPPPTNWMELADTSWSGEGTEASPYLIDTAEKLAGIAVECNNGNDFAGKYFKQTENINLGEFDWYGIGTNSNAFSGTYDGGNKNIVGLRVAANPAESSNSLGLFLYAKNAIIKNIYIVDGCSITETSSGLGMIAGGITESIIENCHVQANIQGLYYSCGGIVGGISDNSKIYDCTFAGSMNILGGVSSPGGSIGGIVGITGNMMLSPSEIKNCTNYGNLFLSLEKANSIGGGSIGGIVGANDNGSDIKNCVNNGNITGKDGMYGEMKFPVVVGGIVGRFTHGIKSNSPLIENCISRGVLTADTACGGIAASIGNGTIKNCMASGQIYITEKTATSVGAILGTGGTGEAIIENCSFNGASNMDIAMFYGGSNAVTVNNSFSRVNSRKKFVGADFSAFGLVDGMNDNLPMLRSLFFLAEASSATSDEIIARLTERGFKN